MENYINNLLSVHRKKKVIQKEWWEAHVEGKRVQCARVLAMEDKMETSGFFGKTVGRCFARANI